jgi:mRNA-degrading endonuclease toxin of MazEF toxin-antitoxin module
MGNSKDIYENLKKVHRLKKKEIRIYKRKKRVPQNQFIRETSLFKGSIWGVPDKSIPFDRRRKEDEYKDSLRPTLVLTTPDTFNDYDLVWVAPGTSKFHKIGNKFPYTLKVEVPPENLEKTTYFLMQYHWFAIQKNMEKKFTELTSETKTKFYEILEDLQ